MHRELQARQMTTPSLKKRYIAKLTTNLVGLVFALVTQTLIPRGLGPKAYGDFSYLTNFFSQLMPFFTLSTSFGFYTKLSQRQGEGSLVSFYFQFTGLAFMALLMFVVGSHFAGLDSYFWKDQHIIYVYMAVMWAMLTWKVQILNQVADAYGLTVSTELAKITQKFLGMVVIVILFLGDKLSLLNFFFYHFVILLLLATVFVWIIGRHGHSLFRSWRLQRGEVKGYVKEFYAYSHPLFVYTVLGMFIGIFDRWLLQTFGGSVQQGFFGLSYQIGAICFLFTSAMTSLITREFAIAFANNDISQMAGLFRRYFPLLFSIAAFFGCFASVQAAKIVYIFGGNQFAEASATLMIMALYPIHQTYGQLSGSIFYATGQTRLYRNIGVIFMLLGLPLVYFMVAPADMMGLNAGASGLAVKFVVLQFVSVNVALFINTKFLHLKFKRYFFHQIVCIACLVGIALFARSAVDYFNFFQHKTIIAFFASGVLYSMFVVAMIVFFPLIFGLRRNDITNLLVSGMNFCRL